MDGTENSSWSCSLNKRRIHYRKKMSGELATDERPNDEKKTV